MFRVVADSKIQVQFTFINNLFIPNKQHISQEPCLNTALPNSSRAD